MDRKWKREGVKGTVPKTKKEKKKKTKNHKKTKPNRQTVKPGAREGSENGQGQGYR